MPGPFRHHLLAGAVALACGAATPAVAQDLQRIAAIVNDQVVSGFDVEQRINLVISSAGLRNTASTRRRLRGQVLRGLVDERLQIQEAQRFNIRVTETDFNRAYKVIERQNGVRAGDVEQFLNAKGVTKFALNAQLEAEIAWGKLIRRRLEPTVVIGDDEVDEMIARIKDNAGKTQHLVSEIFLPVESPENEPEVRAAALRLVEQLRQGAQFAAIARQFSRGSTASSGGDVGWVQAGQLAPQLDEAIERLEVGKISEPIKAPGGFYIVQLKERRNTLGKSADQAKVSLKQVVLPLPKGAQKTDVEAQAALAQTVSEAVSGCDEVATVAKELNSSKFGDLGTVRLNEVPAKIRNAVRNLDTGRFSAPLVTPAGIVLLMVCKREETKPAEPDRERIERELLSRRTATLAERYLRDLRRAAVVELR